MNSESKVIVHPLVLLSVVDHYNRVAKGSNKRVVGALLGEKNGPFIHVTNSFAVPFEEDNKDTLVWFADHNYHERMFLLHKKVNVKENVVGWYSTGPKIKAADLDIHEVFRRYCANPAYVIIDVQPKTNQLPVEAYFSIEQPANERLFRRTFVHIPAIVGAYEAEEVGVEHLLRDIRNASTSTLSTKIADKLNSLKSLSTKLQGIVQYLEDVLKGTLPVNQRVLFNLHELFNKLPDLDDIELKKAFTTESNDASLVIYVGTLIRTILSIHNLIDNKLEDSERRKKERVIEDKKNDVVETKPTEAETDKENTNKESEQKKN